MVVLEILSETPCNGDEIFKNSVKVPDSYLQSIGLSQSELYL